jgi:hypothetical protein
MRSVVPILVAFSAIVTTAPASAQHLSLDIREGRVTLDARDVTLQQILAEWTRIGGVRVINGERVTASPLSLLLRDMSEREALDILLSGQAGYMLVARRGTGTGASAFEGILILASSTPPAAGPAAPIGGAVPDPPQPQIASTEDAGAFAGSIQDEIEKRDATEPAPAASGPAAGIPAGPGGMMRPSTPATAVPPTPALPPRPTANPFGVAPGSAAPNPGTPAGPPPGVYYPPITNPDLLKNGRSAQPGR